MIIGGFEKLSLIDYPGRISSVVFTRGCNFRCIYCHNPQLVLPGSFSPAIPVAEVLAVLKKRINKINSVVVTGGEPTIHPGLPGFLALLKSSGFDVKLDTNGTNPEMLNNLINEKIVDFIAMDIKAVEKKYNSICGVAVDIEKINASIEIIKSSGIDFQFRTTVVKGFHAEADLETIKLKAGGSLVLQRFEAENKELIGCGLGKADVYNETEFNKLADKLGLLKDGILTE